MISSHALTFMHPSPFFHLIWDGLSLCFISFTCYVFCRYFFCCYSCFAISLSLFCRTVTLRKHTVLSFFYEQWWFDVPKRDVVVLGNLTSVHQMYQLAHRSTINMFSVVSEYINSVSAVHDLIAVFGHFWLTPLFNCLKFITDVGNSTLQYLASGMRLFLWLSSFYFW